MDKEQEFPKRKTTRLKDFDYSTTGAYFITINTQDRKSILSRIVSGGEDGPFPYLSPRGKIAEKWIQDIPNKYQDVTVDRYVIMPDHVHLLISISHNDGRGDPSPTVSMVVGWLKHQITKEINKNLGTTGEKIFQRSFYDHIIRNYEDYCEVHKYIHENPIRRYYSDLLPEK
jgi:REP element-mobilizing transposase RayT